jgi:hypothetical protein
MGVIEWGSSGLIFFFDASIFMQQLGIHHPYAINWRRKSFTPRLGKRSSKIILKALIRKRH